MSHFALRLPRRSIEIAVALIGSASLVLGAHAAFNKRAPAKTETISYTDDLVAKPARLALVIGNAHYPDAHAPLTQPVNDARALSAALRRDGFAVDFVEDARRDDITRAVDRLKDRIRPDTVVMLYFGGFGIQSGRESYMIPVDAAIWKESDVRRDGVSIEQVLAGLKERGAQARLAVIDGSRRNPYERRFRSYSHGLAAISAPDNALILTSASPGKMSDDTDAPVSTLISALVGHLDARSGSIETAFGDVRDAVARTSGGAQVPQVTSSLATDVSLGTVADASAAPGN